MTNQVPCDCRYLCRHHPELNRLRAENERMRAVHEKLLRELRRNYEISVLGAELPHDEPKAGILENKLSQDQMQALFTGNGAPGREHHDPTCIKFFGVFSPLPCPCKRPAERTNDGA